jgi:DNA polymerase-3 subunit beta
VGALGAAHAHLSFTTPSRPALLRPATPPGESADADETGEGGATAVEPGPGDTADDLPDPRPGYLYLLMPVRLPG